MANEAARVCIDAGELDAAEKCYAKGAELGLKEPNISPDRKALWEFRLQHARARLAARSAPESMSGLRKQQEPFLPYLLGYVALYLGQPQKALTELEKANQNDAFILCLKADALDRLGRHAEAIEIYRKLATVRGHNPPAAYPVPLARKKIG
jgi:tetratricopeptide (TPR) repeat protein